MARTYQFVHSRKLYRRQADSYFFVFPMGKMGHCWFPDILTHVGILDNCEARSHGSGQIYLLTLILPGSPHTEQPSKLRVQLTYPSHLTTQKHSTTSALTSTGHLWMYWYIGLENRKSCRVWHLCQFSKNVYRIRNLYLG